jgi:hypothetical protein
MILVLGSFSSNDCHRNTRHDCTYSRKIKVSGRDELILGVAFSNGKHNQMVHVHKAVQLLKVVVAESGQEMAGSVHAGEYTSDLPSETRVEPDDAERPSGKSWRHCSGRKQPNGQKIGFR